MPSILAIDDDKEYAPFLGRYLVKLGFEAAFVTSGDLGLEWCKTKRPDLILLDWCLKKGFSGKETLRTFKSQDSTCEIPVVVISGLKEGPEDEIEACESGAVQFFSKQEISDSIPQMEAFRRHLMALIMSRKGGRPSGGVTAKQPCRKPHQNVRVRGRVLMIDDDEEMTAMVSYFLSRKGCTMLTANRAADGLAMAQAEHPDLIILDLGLPDMDGLEVCARLKASQRTRAIPLLILTSRSSTQAHLLALEYGADCYFTKPLPDLDDFHNWIAALLRRKSHLDGPKNILRVGDALIIDTTEHTVTVQDRVIEKVPATLFRVLCELARRPGEILSRDYLLLQVWSKSVRARNVDTAVTRLKHYLGTPVSDWIVCVPGVGFRLNPASGIGREEKIPDA